MASQGTLRADWEGAKRQLAAVGMEMKPFSKNLGPALDAFESARKVYEKVPGTDPGKSDKARKAVIPKAKAAGHIATGYLGLIKDLDKLCIDQRQKRALRIASSTLMAINTELERSI
jgi:hypothetical protein